MLRNILLASLLLGAAPAYAFGPAAHSGEVRIPRMGRFLEWRPDGNKALYIRAENGRWYHATLENRCPRLVTRSNVHFITASNGDLDRYSSVIADGWRCQVASISYSDGPPDWHRHR